MLPALGPLCVGQRVVLLDLESDPLHAQRAAPGPLELVLHRLHGFTVIVIITCAVEVEGEVHGGVEHQFEFFILDRLVAAAALLQGGNTGGQGAHAVFDLGVPALLGHVVERDRLALVGHGEELVVRLEEAYDLVEQNQHVAGGEPVDELLLELLGEPHAVLLLLHHELLLVVDHQFGGVERVDELGLLAQRLDVLQEEVRGEFVLGPLDAVRLLLDVVAQFAEQAHEVDLLADVRPVHVELAREVGLPADAVPLGQQVAVDLLVELADRPHLLPEQLRLDRLQVSLFRPLQLLELGLVVEVDHLLLRKHALAEPQQGHL
mmetsp:Transcript_79569/g.171918  ORF Transcript_79569/g.171918 Transcript_79569/m.171918 type:complete len:320 (-) Transcript_79569:193-1152(-)